ncbi:hypothetical protein BO94DRAFT_621512 [Aspergillus sclerotioniger CBS 115572]|uniref:Lipocalin-like domain-containing protein n=1 Tax=Aspergillus sclerotioniger CBS 115572 TaxID=1450535 RepID=A0A317XAT1_9EURO|nr:hypothetical protein BO94DRAFT_621512 [Aspergillus sclerotioniger CBS 115572]PWY94058.1 hypothetical protein BO94DRAFT_621512 [Aspergillus sclerotioniger CBS 115572]
MVSSPSDLEQEVLGTWALLEYSSEPFDGKGPTIHPMGPDARGILTYTSDGYMTVNVMPTAGNKIKQSIHDGVMYAGRYWIDKKQPDGRGAVMCHDVQMACPAELEGTVLKRQIMVSEGRLRLSSLKYVDLEGLMAKPELVWERISRP